MITGHQRIQDMLANAVAANRLHHALLFWGAPGIGKSTLALYLMRMLNCLSPENGRPCGTCRNCLRISFPFPVHPDVRVFRDITIPLFLHRDEIVQRIQNETGHTGPNSSEAITAEYLMAIERLHENAYLDRYHCCRSANPPVDVLYFNKEKLLSTALSDKSGDTPVLYWLYQKLHLYQQSVCYDRYIKIDMIRDIQKMLYLHPFEGFTKAVVIDDADNMLVPAQNCLLKILEEPPKASVLILITKNPKGLLPTIRSRCQSIPFFRPAAAEVEEALRVRFGFDSQTAGDVSEKAGGSFSCALATDWERQADEYARCQLLFNAGDIGGIDWIMKVSNDVMDRGGGTAGLSRLYKWLHDTVCSQPDADSLNGRLPRNRPFTVDIALRIMDGITDILNRSNYNLDVKLQFESMLVKILRETY
jgi:DNA polymerase III delta prime subunit